MVASTFNVQARYGENNGFPRYSDLNRNFSDLATAWRESLLGQALF